MGSPGSTTCSPARTEAAATRPPPARWGIVGILAMLTLIGVGLIHAESRRARRMALGLVSIGISYCFVVLFAYTRPYVGQFAVKPLDLQNLVNDLDAGQVMEQAASSTADRPLVR